MRRPPCWCCVSVLSAIPQRRPHQPSLPVAGEFDDDRPPQTPHHEPKSATAHTGPARVVKSCVFPIGYGGVA
eukprot:6886720-Prymnesium_polylepis.1